MPPVLRQEQISKPVSTSQAPIPKQAVSKPTKTNQQKDPAKTKMDTGALHQISLKINQNKEKPGPETQDNITALSDIPSEEYSHEQFTTVWEKLATSYKDNSLALFLAMTRHKPVLTQTGSVMLTIDNAIQADMIQEKKPEILSVLRKALRNYKIDIETRIISKKKTEKAYLPTEKLQKLIKKNPAIEKLQKSLGLDLEY